ncbi:MAG: class I SAM-dependent methyltransferase [Verrucomicrobiota bacterium]
MAPVNPIRVTERAQKLATEILRSGDIAVDGTAGKGRDTACLAQSVGPTGHVHAFDIQPEAIASTRNLLEVAGLLGRVSLHLRSHAELGDVLTPSQRGKIGVAIFNLGYLPGGDASIITQPASTDRALRDAYDNLRPGGRLICVAYTGHPGGTEESDIVLKFAEEQAAAGLHVEKIGYYPTPGKPWILVVNKPAA